MTEICHLNEQRLARVAGALTRHASASSLTFAGGVFPAAGAPLALETLAAATLHQYGFWSADDRGYAGPMYASCEGRRLKGSDFVWATFTRAAIERPWSLDPTHMSDTADLVETLCRDDQGRCPLPALNTHESLSQGYGKAMARIEGGIRGLVERCNQTERPGHALLQRLMEVPGYAEDPMAKKANLLLIILSQRPERFLDLRDPESVQPIVDYHLMRGCLRTGVVQVDDPHLQERLAARRWVTEEEEGLLRDTCFQAIEQLVQRSGRTVGEVDGFFFSNGRRACLEMEEAHCNVCVIEEHCGKHTQMFQPIYRTTAY